MEAKKAKTDLILFIFLTILCLVFLFWVTPNQVPVGNNVAVSDFTQRTFPNLLLGGMTLVSLLGVIVTGSKYAKLKKTQREEANLESAEPEHNNILITLIPYITFLVIALYCVLFKKIGFIWSTLLLPLVLMPLFRCKKWYFYLIVYGFCALIYILFKVILYVPLP